MVRYVYKRYVEAKDEQEAVNKLYDEIYNSDDNISIDTSDVEEV